MQEGNTVLYEQYIRSFFHQNLFEFANKEYSFFLLNTCFKSIEKHGGKYTTVFNEYLWVMKLHRLFFSIYEPSKETNSLYTSYPPSSSTSPPTSPNSFLIYFFTIYVVFCIQCLQAEYYHGILGSIIFIFMVIKFSWVFCLFCFVLRFIFILSGFLFCFVFHNFSPIYVLSSISKHSGSL